MLIQSALVHLSRLAIVAQDPPEEPTCEAPKNSYTSRHSALEHGERIDFIFVGTRGATRLEGVSYCQPLPELMPARQHSYSDHEAVAVSLRLVTDTGERGLRLGGMARVGGGVNGLGVTDH